MGVNDLWTVLSPFCERKPIHVLRKKTVAIDLAGWVCENMNVVDYFVNSKQYLRNLFFRTCCLILEDITPVFVLDGIAPELKSQTIKNRTDVQFRGARPKEKLNEINGRDKLNEREKFNFILGHCKTLLNCIGVSCIQAPGEAEAYCAYLNKNGLVDGIISQDSDCFAYGAVRVYRNFSISVSGKNDTVDVYDMDVIQRSLDFGQNKIIVMALLSGCDYYPGGISGIGRDGILKFLEIYKENEILERKVLRQKLYIKSRKGVRLWRLEGLKHKESQTSTRMRTKARQVEALLRNQLSDPKFPFEDITKEYLSIPIPSTDNATAKFVWEQPNLLKFVKEVGPLLQWCELYSFKKSLPLLTGWQLRNIDHMKNTADVVLSPKQITGKCTIKGAQHLKVLWAVKTEFFNELAPILKINNAEETNIFEELCVTFEPLNLLEDCCKDIVQTFLNSEKSVKTKMNSQNRKINKKESKRLPLSPKNKNEHNEEHKTKFQTKINRHPNCTTPYNKCKDLLADRKQANKQTENLSNIIDLITSRDKGLTELPIHQGRRLNYEPIKK